MYKLRSTQSVRRTSHAFQARQMPHTFKVRWTSHNSVGSFFFVG
jgi:hypothetical protein